MIKKVLKESKGSLTVEASIVLPLFVCVVLTIGFLIKIVYTHEVIQHAIDEAANSIATSSYIYYSSGFGNIEDSLYEKLESHKNNERSNLQQLDNIKKEIYQIVQAYENDNKDNINDNKNNILDIFRIIGSISVSGLESDLKAIATSGEIEAYNHVKQLMGNLVLRREIEKQILIDEKGSLKERLESLHIVTSMENENNSSLNNFSFYGLDFSQSRYLYNNEEIDIIVTYKVNLPLPIDFIGDISMMQRASARAWVGDNFTTQDRIVYITRTGECYHKESCYHLSKSKIPVSLKKVLIEGKYRPCSYCIGK